MKNKRKIFIPCEQASHLCNKAQYNEASLFEKILLNIHLIYCKACRIFSIRNKTLSKLLKSPDIQHLESEERQRMKDVFNEALSQNNPQK